MRKVTFSSIALVAVIFGGPALAADIPIKAPAYKAPAAVAAANWTGCFLGGNVGGGWSRHSFTDPITTPVIDLQSHTASGVVGGGQIGCDYQSGPWVFGVQGMLDAASLRGTHIFATGAAQFNLLLTAPGFPLGVILPGSSEGLTTRIPWLATATARLGYAVQPPVLLYVRGGAAWVRDKHTLEVSTTGIVGEANVTRTGWTVGAGVDYLLARNWSMFAEYDYLDFGTERLTFTSVPPFPPVTAAADVTQKIHLVLIGFNYRFNWSGVAAAK
ncbi:MAG: outer membrane beta-barrel protein [Xanthobacteraceae bacterium]|jgi:outer membrane immunogenic protein